MTDWKTCTIGDLGMVIGGATPSTKKAENYDDGTISWITPKDLADFSGRFISYGERNITKQGLKSCSTKLMPKHTVLFSSRAPIGYIAIANQELCTNQGFKSVVPNDDTDYKFLYYLLKYNKNKIENLGSGTTFKEVSGSTMRGIKVSVPASIEEQRKIASILSLLDDKIEKNTEINKNLEEQIRILCNAWLNDYVPFGGICPSNWLLTPLSSFAKFISGYSYKGTELQESSVAMATIKNFDRKGGFKLDGYKEIVPSSKLKPEHHAELFDTLVAHTDLTQNAEVIGNAEPVLSFSGYEDIIFSMDVVRVLPEKPTISKFLIAAMLKTQQFKTHCLGYVNGTTVLHLSKKALPEYSLMLPEDFTVLHPLDEAVSSMYKQMALNIDETVQLTNLRDALLPQLMSGEIDVSNLDL